MNPWHDAHDVLLDTAFQHRLAICGKVAVVFCPVFHPLGCPVFRVGIVPLLGVAPIFIPLFYDKWHTLVVHDNLRRDAIHFIVTTKHRHRVRHKVKDGYAFVGFLPIEIDYGVYPILTTSQKVLYRFTEHTRILLKDLAQLVVLIIINQRNPVRLALLLWLNEHLGIGGNDVVSGAVHQLCAKSSPMHGLWFLNHWDGKGVVKVFLVYPLLFEPVCVEAVFEVNYDVFDFRRRSQIKTP